MKRSVVVPLAVVVVAGAGLLRERTAEAAAIQELPPVAAATPRPVPAEAAPTAEHAAPAPRPAADESPIAALEGPATVVPIEPHDEVPLPPRDDGPVHENDAIEPELPQTAGWKHEKTVHIAAALDRHVERTEAMRLAAVERGDQAEAQRLKILVERQRKRLASIREDAEQLAQKAALEGELVAAP